MVLVKRLGHNYYAKLNTVLFCLTSYLVCVGLHSKEKKQVVSRLESPVQKVDWKLFKIFALKMEERMHQYRY